MDAAKSNEAKYKAGFSNNSTKKDFVKVSPLKIVPGLSPEHLASLGLKVLPYPTPINTSK